MDVLSQAMAQTVLDILDLVTVFSTQEGEALAVDGASLSLNSGETLAVAGESGCGKSVLALSIMGLVPDPPGRVVEGEILYRGSNLLALPEKEMRAIRGKRIAMIFQEPMTSLNPVFKVGEQVAEAIRLHRGRSDRQALKEAVDMLAQVGIPNPGQRAKSYPHELSGGMRQRVMIAMALSCDPDILIADEPTTALDVTIQAQILDLMEEMKERKGATILLITHDPGVVAQAAQRVAIMYTGRIVEMGPVKEVFKNPLHPYTQGIMASVPVPGREGDLTPIKGMVPRLTDLPEGCTFHPRCPEAFDKCKALRPPDFEPAPGRTVRCWLHE